MMPRPLCLPVLLAAVLLATACSGEPADRSEAGKAGATLNAALAAEPDQLDPQKATTYASFQVLENIFDTLVEPDERLQMQPSLATGWTTSTDQLSWTFTLRTGVSFHNGDPFDADDVVYSFQRIIKGKLATVDRFESVEDVFKLDPFTVRIDLKRPTPNLLADLGSDKGMAIVDEKNAESGEIAKQPIGTGPFYFESYQRGTALTLGANDKYWGTAPKLSTVKFGFVADPDAALNALRSGTVQWTDNLPPAELGRLMINNDLSPNDPVAQSTPGNEYWYLTVNEKKKPFNDARVRQAFAWALDREAIAQAARPGAAQPIQTAIPRTSNWYSDYAPYREDPVRAKALLRQSGVKNLKVDFMVPAESPEAAAAAKALKEQLAPFGVTLNLRTEDRAKLTADQANGKFDGLLLNRAGGADPDDVYFDQHFSKGRNNYQKFKDRQVDQQLLLGRSTSDPARRKEIYDQAAQLIVDQASYLYLYQPAVVQAWSPALTGYSARTDRAIRFRDAALIDP